MICVDPNFLRLRPNLCIVAALGSGSYKNKHQTLVMQIETILDWVTSTAKLNATKQKKMHERGKPKKIYTRITMVCDSKEV